MRKIKDFVLKQQNRLDHDGLERIAVDFIANLWHTNDVSHEITFLSPWRGWNIEYLRKLAQITVTPSKILSIHEYHYHCPPPMHNVRTPQTAIFEPLNPVLKNTIWHYPHHTPVQEYSYNIFSKYKECKNSKNMKRTNPNIRPCIDSTSYFG